MTCITDALFGYYSTIIMELPLLSDVSTDDYLIDVRFATVERVPLCTTASFKSLMKSRHKTPFSQVLHAVLSRIIVLRTALHCLAVIPSLRLTGCETKDWSVCGRGCSLRRAPRRLWSENPPPRHAARTSHRTSRRLVWGFRGQSACRTSVTMHIFCRTRTESGPNEPKRASDTSRGRQ